MAIRRRRRRKYTWFPILGTSQGESTSRATIASLALDVSTTGVSVVGVKPLTYDVPADNETAYGNLTTPLNDFIGDEYFLKRIVGKLYVQNLFTNGTVPGSDAPPQLITAGFFVARCDESDSNQPVAFSSEPDLYNPALTDTVREPWIWRRTWLLGNGGQGTAGGGAFALPAANNQEASSFEGTHVDAKTARRIRQQERLFLAVASQNYPLVTATPTGALNVILTGFDLRILGSLRKSRNRGSF